MDRYWLLTNTFYGTWLPGDERGFVGQVTDHRPDDELRHRVRHHQPGTEYDRDIPGLRVSAAAQLKGEPILLTGEQAGVLLSQFLETATYRSWEICAAAIMLNHDHLVVGVPGDPDPGRILGDFKSWGTRALSERFGKPPAGRWWTERGSKRKLQDERAVQQAIAYVRLKQPNPLVVWPK